MPSKETVLITGCSDGGIGSALAIAFQKRGFRVFATARDMTKMTHLKDLPNVTLLRLDVADESDVKAAADTVSNTTGGALGYLISNAGRNHFMPILDEDIDRVKKLFNTNLWGPLALTLAFAPLLINSKGVVAYITSISGYLNIPYMGSYAASKRALELIAETLRLELSPFGVDVISVVTGGVKTNGQTYFSDFALPEESLYKPIEKLIAGRARGEDGMPRMDLMEYATEVAGKISERTAGKFWYGQHADSVKTSATSSVPQDMIDASAIIGTGLDGLGDQTK